MNALGQGIAVSRSGQACASYGCCSYGRLDRASLTRLQSTCDTSKLLRAVEQLNRVAGNARGQDGLRDVLLRLHGMAHAVVNGAGLSGSAQESLPELAFEATSEIRQTDQLNFNIE